MKKEKVNTLKKLILTTPFLFVLIIGNIFCGDDNGDDIENCECTTTLHITGEYCCEGANCNCETVAGARVEGIAVTNRQDIEADAFEFQRDEFIKGFGWLNETQQAFVKDNLKEVCVVPGPASNDPSISQGILTIESGSNAASIWSALDEFASASKKFDLAKEIHMALYGNLNTML